MEEKEFLENLINNHWEYIKALLVAHEEPESTIILRANLPAERERGINIFGT